MAGRASGKTSLQDYRDLLILVLILIAIACVSLWNAWHIGEKGAALFKAKEAWTMFDGAVAKWRAYLVLLAAFAAVAGHGVTGYWRGILVDPRNRLSLSRLQFLAWTIVVLSAVLAAAMHNLGLPGTADSLGIKVPSQIWVLLGISTTSAVGAPAVLGNKRPKKPQQQEQTQTALELANQQRSTVDTEKASIVLNYKSPADARWADLLKGDETGNGAKVDLGKLQMLLFTFVLMLGYAAAFAGGLESTKAVTSLPEVGEGLNTLLGISHTGYLANKAVAHSSEADDSDGSEPAS